MVGLELKQRFRDEGGFGLVEVLVATVILVIGVVALAGMTMSVADQVTRSEWQSEQIVAGQQILEDINRQGYAAAASGTDTVTIDGHDYVVKMAVTQPSTRVKEVQALVAPVGVLKGDTLTTRLYASVELPSEPTAGVGGMGGGGGGGGGGEDPPPEDPPPEDPPEEEEAPCGYLPNGNPRKNC